MAMAVDKEVRDSLWVDGQFTVRVRGVGSQPGRIVRIRRPFALIGQIPGADILIDAPEVDGRHALLLLDDRGLFGVDLRSRTGTRFAGAEAVSSWLGAGDILEVSGRRVEILQLRVGGSTIDPPLSTDDPLSDAPGLVGLTLKPVGGGGTPWRLGSSLAFVGRGDACAIRVENASASLTHCALLRTCSHAYVIDLMGRRTLINDQAVNGASRLSHGDVLTIGQAEFILEVDTQLNDSTEITVAPSSSQAIVRASEFNTSTELACNPRLAIVELIRDALESHEDVARFEVIDVLRQFQADTATLFEAQIEKIESLNLEVSRLRDQIQGRLGPLPSPAEPLRLDLPAPPTASSDESAAWLLDRISSLETESRSTWKDLFGRIAATVGPRATPTPGQSLAPTRPRETSEG